MKSGRIMLRGALAALVLTLLAGCASDKPKEPAPAAAAPVVPPVKAPAPEAAVTPPPVRRAAQMNPLNDPHSILAKRSVYYDFDASDVRPDFRPLIEAHAAYLHTHPNAKITIQGNCDERGSREYNIALGQRRADGVRKMLGLLGAGDSQMESVSFGEEKPKAMGHDDAAWAENRRSDIVYEKAE